MRRIPDPHGRKSRQPTHPVSVCAVARNMNIPEGTVLAHAKRNGWTQQITEAKQLAKMPDESPTISPADAVSELLADDGRATRRALSRAARRSAERVAETGVEIESAATFTQRQRRRHSFTDGATVATNLVLRFKSTSADTRLAIKSNQRLQSHGSGIKGITSPDVTRQKRQSHCRKM